MKAVSRFEASLLRILHCILQQASLAQVAPLLGRQARPKCLSRAAVELVQDALRKGVPLLLARAGGWRRQRFLRSGRAQEGRLWERSTPEELALTYSDQTMEFLLWLTAAKPKDDAPPQADRPATLADQLLAVLTFAAFHKSAAAPAWRQFGGWPGNALFQLLYPGEETSTPTIDWQPWLTSAGAGILEALQARLAERWLDIERHKGEIHALPAMRRLGEAQELVLSSYLDALHRAGRWDLARFLLETARGLLEDEPTARRWTGRLEVGNLRLADRVAVYQAALTFVRLLARLAQWEQEARTIGYFDEGYAAAQLWKSDWEHYDGDGLCRRAAALVREVEP